MTLTEASALAGTIKGAIPMMTDLQTGLAIQELAKHSLAVGDAAVRRYVREHDDFRLKYLIDALASKSRGSQTTPPHAKTRPLDQQQIQHWQRVDEVIASLDDAELARHHQAVAESVQPGRGRVLIERANPREHRWLKRMIAARLGEALTA